MAASSLQRLCNVVKWMDGVAPRDARVFGQILPGGVRLGMAAQMDNGDILTSDQRIFIEEVELANGDVLAQVARKVLNDLLDAVKKHKAENPVLPATEPPPPKIV